MHEEGPFHILVADDEEPFRHTTARLLERHGMICSQANSAGEALALLAEIECDVLVADIKMPGNDDLALLAGIREQPGAPVVILVTGYPSVDTAVSSMELGVFAYQIKPFDFSEFIDQVQQAGAHARLRKRIRRQQEEMQHQAQRLEMLRTVLVRPGVDGLEQTVCDYLSVLMLAMADTALEAGSLLDCLNSGKEPVRKLSRHPELDAYRAAVAECIRVLEQTKNSFKSKELANLRRQLQLLVDVT